MATYRIKAGVRVAGLRPEAVLGYLVGGGVMVAKGHDAVMTAGVDGGHMSGSDHYKGDAVDMRTRHLGVAKAAIVGEISAALNYPGGDYDVLLEGEGTTNEHLHIEFDPKTGINR